DFTLGDCAQKTAKIGDPRWITSEPTGIETIQQEVDNLENAVIYNLQGVRVEKAQKGLYIVNGRKVVIK
ncbi:MAG: hypothetical protein J1E37_01180, partial [Prevotella sp.]|nr:hypothetical protein [Prevotella sp.]